MSQKTAVQLLIEEFEKYVNWIEGDHKATSYTITDFNNALIHALDIEKSQLEDAWSTGDEEGSTMFFSHWYNLRYRR